MDHSSLDLSFLTGINLDTLIREGKSMMFRNVTREQIVDFNHYISDLRLPFRLSFEFSVGDDSKSGYILVVPASPMHNATIHYLNYHLAEWNIAISGDWEVPTRSIGVRNVEHFKGQFQPDVSFEAAERVIKSPNVVFEVHYRSNMGLWQFIVHCARHITLTNDVMSVMVIDIYENGAMVICEIRRHIAYTIPLPAGAVLPPPFLIAAANPNAALLHAATPPLVATGTAPTPVLMAANANVAFYLHNLMSFGYGSPHTEAINAWCSYTGLPCRGVGIDDLLTPGQNYPACNQANIPMYQYPIQHQRLMARDNFGLVMWSPPPGQPTIINPPADYVLDLFTLQRQFRRELGPLS